MLQSGTKLTNKREVAEATTAFYFEKPVDFKFEPGQYAYLHLPKLNYMDEKGLTRHLSIASSPDEPELMFATRIRNSAFKKTLKEMAAGTEIQIEGPSGSFLLHDDSQIPVCFLAGGIGITPFRSMIKYATSQKPARKITLFYSNRKPEDAPFLEELQELEKQSSEGVATRPYGAGKNFRLVATMTEMQYSIKPWAGLKGYINADLIKEKLPEWENAIYYIAGPTNMVQAMNQMLVLDLNVPPNRIKTENFSGY